MNKFTNFLLGCTLGDALGSPVEGKNKSDTQAYITEVLKGLNVHNRSGYIFTGQVSYVTQLTLCMAKTLIDRKGYERKYLMELMSAEWKNKTLIRADRSCIHAFRNYCKGLPLDKCGDRPGRSNNGAAVRVGLLGLWFKKEKDVISNAIDAARLTHHDPGSVAAAVAISLAVFKFCCRKNKPSDVLRDIAKKLRNMDGTMSKIISQIPALLDRSTNEALSRIVTMGYHLKKDAPAGLILRISSQAATSVGWTLYCLSKHPDNINEALKLLFYVGGDMNSMASMLLSILCCRLGINKTLRQYVRYLHDKSRWKSPYLKTLGNSLYKRFISKQK